MIRLILAFTLLWAGCAQAQMNSFFPGPGTAHSAGGCADANVIAWKAAVVGAGGAVSGTKETQICDLVNNLKGNGGPHSGTNLFSGALGKDRIWLFGTDNVQQATYDLVAASALTNSGSSWGATTGWTGNGSTSFVNTNFADNAGTTFVRDSATVTTCILNNRTSVANMVAWGANDAAATGQTSRFFPYANPGNVISELNEGASFYQFSNVAGTTQGLWTSSRTGSTTVDVYRNGSATSLNTSTNASVATVALNFYVGGENNNSLGLVFPSTDNIGMIAFGAGLSGANALLFHTDINTYMTASSAACF